MFLHWGDLLGLHALLLWFITTMFMVLCYQGSTTAIVALHSMQVS
jgi:hypothetical protein